MTQKSILDLRRELMLSVEEKLEQSLPEKVYVVRHVHQTLWPEDVMGLLKNNWHRPGMTIDWETVDDIFVEKDAAHQSATHRCYNNKPVLVEEVTSTSWRSTKNENGEWSPSKEVTEKTGQTRYWINRHTTNSGTVIDDYAEVWEVPPSFLTEWIISMW